jgi:hypothetical protein
MNKDLLASPKKMDHLSIIQLQKSSGAVFSSSGGRLLLDTYICSGLENCMAGLSEAANDVLFCDAPVMAHRMTVARIISKILAIIVFLCENIPSNKKVRLTTVP